MKAPDKVRALSQHAHHFGKHWAPPETSDGDRPVNGASALAARYPSKIVDLIIFHKLHCTLPADFAVRSYERLKSEFVDWNEIRISSVREIQEALGVPEVSLELAVFIKDLLDLVHRERQDVSLEFLADQNHGEIRRYLKQVRGIDSATVDLILRLRKEHPVFPLNSAVEIVLTRLGVLRGKGTVTHREKLLHDLVEPDRAMVLHHFLLNHSREICPPSVEAIACSKCGIRGLCEFYARTKGKARKNSPRTPGPRGNGATAHPSRSGVRGAAPKKARRK